ncbi:MAG: 3-hydroxyacyl-ACP dehydratase FabZ [Candidatus Omnitrophica bacterium]|nr:3-hydroxyacyl-ACP dehydratase FabZ [Candidatus Omnitrophota bacterium]
MSAIWDIEQIKAILPQDYPFLFIDRVTEINEKDKKIKCLKNFSYNEHFFQGHFPKNPVVPGAIIIEALAQASIILYSVLKPDIANKKPSYYLGKVDAHFLKPVSAGSQLTLEVNAAKILNNSGMVEARALVENEVVARARIFFGVKLKENNKRGV